MLLSFINNAIFKFIRQYAASIYGCILFWYVIVNVFIYCYNMYNSYYCMIFYKSMYLWYVLYQNTVQQYFVCHSITIYPILPYYNYFPLWLLAQCYAKSAFQFISRKHIKKIKLCQLMNTWTFKVFSSFWFNLSL